MWYTEALIMVPSWLWYLIAVSLLLYLYGIWPYITSSIRLPGPKPAPFVGNLLQEIEKGFIQSDVMGVKNHGRVFLSWRGRWPIINVADPDMIKQICVRDFQNFTNRSLQKVVPLTPTRRAMLICLEDDHWKFVRSVLSPAFSSGKMRMMVPLIHKCLKRLNENLSEYSKTDKSFEAKSVMGGLTMEVIGAVGFGIDTDAQKDVNDQFLVMASRVFGDSAMRKLPAMVSSLFPFALPLLEEIGMTADSKETTDYFVTMLKKTIEERRKQTSPRKDLLQLLLNSSVDDLKETLADKDVDVDALKIDKLDRNNTNNKLNDKEVIAQTLLFLIAGFETTSAALAFLAYNLAVHPECQEKLIREIDSTLNGTCPTYDNVMSLPYLDMCLSETQRLYPAVRGVSRVARESVTVNGVHIPANVSVLLLVYALQHDETYWPDPEKFDPERWSPEQKAGRHPYVYFPFGVGPRNCVGMRLAQMEAKMAAVAMLQKFRFIRAPETEVPLTMKKGSFVHAENGVWLRVQSRD